MESNILDTLKTGTILLNTYEIIEAIGSGGGGITYKAKHLRLNTYVVVKKIKDSVLEKVNTRVEVDILKRLKHAYLPRVYDFIETDDGVYTIIDFISGMNFKDAVTKHGAYSQKEVLKWANQLGEAIAYLHSQTPAIIHSDIKPENIMLTEDGNVCLIDFNIALALGENKESAIGISPGFSPPEQFTNCAIYEKMVNGINNETKTELLKDEINKNTSNKSIIENRFAYNKQMGRGVDTRSDIYSLGMTLIYLLTGVRPTLDYSNRVTIEQTNIIISDGLKLILNRMIDFDPDKRYQDGKAFRNAINNIHKVDSRYKVVHRNYIILQYTSIILLILGVSMITYGIIRQINNNKNNYYSLLDDAEQLIQDGLYDNAEDLINEALKIDSDKAEAYKEKFYLMYCSGQYEDVIKEGTAYINSSSFKTGIGLIPENEKKSEMLSIGDIYYLIGEAHFELSEFDSAEAVFKSAIEYNDSNVDYYRDYAIVLAKNEKIDSAIACLDKAETLGIANDSLYLVKGQISFVQGENEDAISNYQKTIEVTQDEQLKKRAILMCSEIYKKLGGSYLDDDIMLLCEYKDSFGLTGGLMLKEYLVQTYLKKAASDSKYYEDALSELTEIVNSGYSSFQIKENIAIIYSNMHEYDKATDILYELENEYPDNYKVYKDLAFLESYKQQEKKYSERNYDQFKYYYEKASELCNQPNDEMEMLRRAVEELGY